MKKIKWITSLSMLLFVSLFIQGCTNSEAKKKVEESKNSLLPILYDKEADKKSETANRIDAKLNKQYTKETWSYKSKELTLANDILPRENDLIVSDSKGDRLVILDHNGKILKTVGKTGSGPLEFSNPTGVTSYKDKIYIIDGMNDRIQILDKEFKYIKEIKLPRDEENPEFPFRDIEIDKDGTIYLSGGQVDNPGILYYENDNADYKWIRENFEGYMAEIDGEIYAINRGIFYTSKDNEEWGIRSGENYLLKVNKSGLEKVCELPFGITSNDFTINNNKEIVSVSGGYYQLLRMNMKVEYIDSIGEVNLDKSTFAYINIDKNGTYYFTDGASGNIYLIKKGN